MPFDYHGALYNHFAIETGKLAPNGWRIPSEQDFKELEAYVAANGHEGEEASALKSTFGWFGNNGTDDFGFNVLPAGYAAAQGTATGAFSGATLATTDVNPEFPNTSSQTRRGVGFAGSESTINYGNNSITIGLTIRCIKE